MRFETYHEREIGPWYYHSPTSYCLKRLHLILDLFLRFQVISQTLWQNYIERWKKIIKCFFDIARMKLDGGYLATFSNCTQTKKGGHDLGGLWNAHPNKQNITNCVVGLLIFILYCYFDRGMASSPSISIHPNPWGSKLK